MFAALMHAKLLLCQAGGLLPEIGCDYSGG
jgi:hypothetical protein